MQIHPIVVVEVAGDMEVMVVLVSHQRAKRLLEDEGLGGLEVCGDVVLQDCRAEPSHELGHARTFEHADEFGPRRRGRRRAA